MMIYMIEWYYKLSYVFLILSSIKLSTSVIFTSSPDKISFPSCTWCGKFTKSLWCGALSHLLIIFPSFCQWYEYSLQFSPIASFTKRVEPSFKVAFALINSISGSTSIYAIRNSNTRLWFLRIAMVLATTIERTPHEWISSKDMIYNMLSIQYSRPIFQSLL